MGTVAAADVAVSETLAKSAQAKHHAADADANEQTHLFVTGFSRFHRIFDNPTERLADALATAGVQIDRVELASCSVLQVAAESARRDLDALYTRIADLPHARNAVIHLGVNAGARRFALERVARNEATFTCADERGWAPIKHVIDPAFGALSATRHTRVPVGTLARRLCDQGFDVEVSTDAGRFVCNWLYFHSLAHAHRQNAATIFVHVPPVAVVPFDHQLSFLHALIACIADLPDLTFVDQGDS